MELQFNAARIYRKSGSNYNQVFGNNISNLHPRAQSHRCTGSTPAISLIPDLKVKEGIINIVVRIEDQPFEGATHQMWVYGAPYTRRISAQEPNYHDCEEGNLMAVGDAYLDIWCDHEYFANHGPRTKCFKVWLSARRSTEADSGIPFA